MSSTLHDNLADKHPRFLVIRCGAIGDTLMVTPLLRSLRVSFPDAYLAALTSQTAIDVLRYNPHVDEVFAIKNRHLPFFLSREKRRLASYFRGLGLTAVLSLESNRHFTDIACRIEPGRLVTYDTTASCGEVRLISNERGEHSAEFHLRAGQAIGADAAGTMLELHYPPELDQQIADRLSENGIRETDLLVGIHAGWGSRKQNPDDTRLRSWPADRFAEIIRYLTDEFSAKVVITGTVLDRGLNDIIAARSGVAVLNAAGSFSLLEYAALIRRMNLYLTIDSGPAHIAAALGTPLITLWGPAILTATRPLPGRAPVRLLQAPPPCAPCYGTPLMKTCRDNICMKQINVPEVKAAIDELLPAIS